MERKWWKEWKERWVCIKKHIFPFLSIPFHSVPCLKLVRQSIKRMNRMTKSVKQTLIWCKVLWLPGGKLCYISVILH